MNRLLPILFAFVYLSKSAYAQSNDFECDFETDTCGLVNDDHHEAKWVRKVIDLGGRKGYAMILETGAKVKQMGRLLTPFFRLEQNGEFMTCLSLDLFIAGNGVNAFQVKQIDDSGVKPYQPVDKNLVFWRKFIYGTAPDGDSLRFMIDAEVDPNLGETVVAIDNISFKPEACYGRSMN